MKSDKLAALVTAVSVVLKGKTGVLEAVWKDKFAASKFWNHKIAEKTSFVCGQNSFLNCSEIVFSQYSLFEKQAGSPFHPSRWSYRIEMMGFGLAKAILRIVPFTNRLTWKHKSAKAANLWVKLQLPIVARKNAPLGLRGATQAEQGNYTTLECENWTLAIFEKPRF